MGKCPGGFVQSNEFGAKLSRVFVQRDEFGGKTLRGVFILFSLWSPLQLIVSATLFFYKNNFIRTLRLKIGQTFEQVKNIPSFRFQIFKIFIHFRWN